jgi:hypothetical protein
VVGTIYGDNQEPDMTNVHIKEAANNMRKAVNDVRILMQQTQAGANDRQREIEDRIGVIAQEKEQLQIRMRSGDSDATGAEHFMLVRKLDDEENKLRKEVADLQMNTAKQTQELDQQAYQFDDLAKQLDMMA